MPRRTSPAGALRAVCALAGAVTAAQGCAYDWSLAPGDGAGGGDASATTASSASTPGSTSTSSASAGGGSTPGSGDTIGLSAYACDGTVFVDGAAVDAADHVFIAGAFTGSCALPGGAELAAAGPDVPQPYALSLTLEEELLWSLSCGVTGGVDGGFYGGITALPGGGAFVAGGSRGDLACGATSLPHTGGDSEYDAVLLLLDAGGNVQTPYLFGGPDTQLAHAVAASTFQKPVIAGEMKGTLDAHALGMFTDADSSPDVFVISPDGGSPFAHQIQSSSGGATTALAVAAEAGGGTIVGGFLEGAVTLGSLETQGTSRNAFLARLVPSMGGLADVAWGVRFASGGGAGVTALAVDASGGPAAGWIVAVGSFATSIDIGAAHHVAVGPSDVFVAAFDPMGGIAWSHAFGGAGCSASVSSAALAPDGRVVVGGSVEGDIDFGAGPLASIGTSDIFLAVFEEDGQLRFARRFGAPPGGHLGGLARFASDSVLFLGSSDAAADFGFGHVVPAPPGSGTELFVARFAL